MISRRSKYRTLSVFTFLVATGKCYGKNICKDDLDRLSIQKTLAFMKEDQSREQEIWSYCVQDMNTSTR